MLDPNAQKSLLENAATVNEIILAVCEANVKEYKDMLTSFTDPTSKVTDENGKALYKETFGKEAQQSLNIKTLLDLPDMKKGKIEGVIEIMKDRETADKLVAKTIKIAAVTSASTTPVISTTAFTDYYKSDFDVKYWFETPVFAMVLPIFKDDDSINLVLTYNNSTKEIRSEFMSDDDVTDNLGTQVTRGPTYQEEIDAIEKSDKYKEWANADSYFKSEKEINAQMDTDKKIALAKIEELKKLLSAKEGALRIATSASDSTKEAELKKEIDAINNESIPAEQIKVDQKTISDGFKSDLKAAEDAKRDWFATLFANAEKFNKSNLFKKNDEKKVFWMGPEGKRTLNPLEEKRASPLWFISSSINGPLRGTSLQKKKVEQVIKDKIQKGENFYSIKSGEQFTTFADFLNFDSTTA